MKHKLLILFILLGGTFSLNADFWDSEEERKKNSKIVWQYKLRKFSQKEYSRSVKALFRNFESTTGYSLRPGDKKKVGLKIYTNSGTGIATPKPLVKAVINSLMDRGYEKSDIFILDHSELKLRECGFIPPLSRRSEGNLFNGVPVKILESNKYFDSIWYYEDPLPANYISILDQEDSVFDNSLSPDAGRKSYLPYPLIAEVDFWINLPMVTVDQTIGVRGALVNATLMNIGNNDRFLNSVSVAPKAIAEISAIPELLSTWALTIMPLEIYQFIGGPNFNSLYTHSEPFLWMSTNPVLLDRLVLKYINKRRAKEGFEKFKKIPLYLKYAVKLDVGTSSKKNIEWIKLPHDTFGKK